MNLINKIWYQKKYYYLGYILWPLSLIFAMAVYLRRFLYAKEILKSYKPGAPVIVVGNITVGGTGKTPMVIFLCHELKRLGFRPGIITRGYKGKQNGQPGLVPGLVTDDSTADDVGDEAVLLHRSAHVPVMVCKKRLIAAKELLQQTDCNIIISDDGLQHYQLARDLEIVMIDGERMFGNALMLPAGPLREPVSRLQRADFVVVNGESQIPNVNTYNMKLQPSHFVAVNDRSRQLNLAELQNKEVYAVAGIGNPDRFFNLLSSLNIKIIATRVLPDHHRFTLQDISFDNNKPVIMTAKDAVKCQDFASDKHWYLAVTADVNAGFVEEILNGLAGSSC